MAKVKISYALTYCNKEYIKFFFISWIDLKFIYFLFQESGLVIVSSDEGVLSLEKCLPNGQIPQGGSLLISADSAELLEKAGVGSLGKINYIQCPMWWAY